MGKHLPQTVSEFKVHCIVSVHTTHTHTHTYKLAGLVLAMFMEGVGVGPRCVSLTHALFTSPVLALF